MDHPYFQKEIGPVKIMKIYWRSGYEKHRFVFIAYASKLRYLATYHLQSHALFNMKTKYILCSPIKITSYPLNSFRKIKYKIITVYSQIYTKSEKEEKEVIPF